MKRTVLASFALAALLSVSSLAETKSDYDHHYKLDGAKTWNFKTQESSVNDAVCNNRLWGQRIGEDITQQLAAAGFTQTQNATPNLLVSTHLNTQERVETQYVHTGHPGHFTCSGRLFCGWQSGWSETTVV
jgi:hypothetical protein